MGGRDIDFWLGGSLTGCCCSSTACCCPSTAFCCSCAGGRQRPSTSASGLMEESASWEDLGWEGFEDSRMRLKKSWITSFRMLQKEICQFRYPHRSWGDLNDGKLTRSCQ